MSENSQSVSSVICFGPFDADLQTQELRKHGVRIRLPGQSFQILRMLLERPGQLIPREEFQKALWPSDTYIEFDHGVNAAVNRLREALGDSADNPRLIETLPRRGYRFIGTITSAELIAEPPSAVLVSAVPTTAPASSPARVRWPKVAVLSLAALACVVVAAFSLLRWHRPDSLAVQAVPFTALPGWAGNPAFSPDGSRIAFEWNGGQDKGFDLYVKAIGSQTVLRLTNKPSDAIVPAWSPDGARIAFHRISGSESGIYLISAPSGTERKLRSTNPSLGLSLRISWSPDGKGAAFADAPVSGGHRRIYLLSLETSESRQIEHDETCLAVC